MPKTKREPVKTSNVIHCIECNQDFDCTKTMEPFKAHLTEAHKITDFKGKRHMLMHTDGANWFSYEWEWEIGGKKFIQNTIQPRSKADQMYWDAAGE